MDLTVAIPCRADEPDPCGAVERALAAAEACSDRGEVLVCINGTAPEESPAAHALRRLAVACGVGLDEVAVDARSANVEGPAGPARFTLLHSHAAGKALAWNTLRRRARGDCMIFLDADVQCGPDAPGRLMDALRASPDAVLAGGRTVAAPRPGWFERMQATPYDIAFPNLSPQMYAARRRFLPPAMPEGLLEPERWLELVVGASRIVRVPDATVAVRLPHDLRDFFRQRVRIEMGKVQIRAEYPGLHARGATQPGARAVVAHLGTTALARLAVYLALRETAHVVARHRYRRGGASSAWRQARSTKLWDGP